MIRRLTIILLSIIFTCSSLWADQEYTVSLERGGNSRATITLPYANVTFTLFEYGSQYSVEVSLENTTVSDALLLFKNSMGEKELKGIKPKIEFIKTYGGSKGNRNVYGCKNLAQAVIALTPADDAVLMKTDIKANSTTRLELPLYQAKFDPKQLNKKGTYSIKYQILNQDVPVFNIELKGWTPNDPEYIATKRAVDAFLQSLKTAAFCRDKRHKPSLAEQQAPYIAKRDSLSDAIESILVKHREWISEDAPHIAYSALKNKLREIDLNDRNLICDDHKKKQQKVGKPNTHSCNLCSLSAKEIYHQLDDIFQQLHAGKISKDNAKKKAQSLYNCYQNSTKRKKDSFYSGKITGFYNRIMK